VVVPALLFVVGEETLLDEPDVVCVEVVDELEELLDESGGAVVVLVFEVVVVEGLDWVDDGVVPVLVVEVVVGVVVAVGDEDVVPVELEVGGVDELVVSVEPDVGGVVELVVVCGGVFEEGGVGVVVPELVDGVWLVGEEPWTLEFCNNCLS
jgi:hypothetical protein